MNSLSNSNKFFLKACEFGNLEALVEVVTDFSNQVDKSCCDKEGNNALHLASKFGNIKVLQYLIDDLGLLFLHKTSNKEGNFPIHLSKSFEVVSFFVENCGIDINQKSLSREETFLFKLIQKFVDQKDLLRIVDKYVDLIDFSVISTYNNTNILHQSIEFGYYQLFSRIIKYYEDGKAKKLNICEANKFGNTIVHLSINLIASGTKEKNEIKINKGVQFLTLICRKFSNKKELMQKNNKFGHSPLFLCIEKANLYALRIILKIGKVNINSLNTKKETGLIRASELLRNDIRKITNLYKNRYYQIMDYLLKMNIDVSYNTGENENVKIKNPITNLLLHEKIVRMYHIEKIGQTQRYLNLKNELSYKEIDLHEKNLEIENLKKEIDKKDRNLISLRMEIKEMEKEKEKEIKIINLDHSNQIKSLKDELYNRNIQSNENSESLIEEVRKLKEKIKEIQAEHTKELRVKDLKIEKLTLENIKEAEVNVHLQNLYKKNLKKKNAQIRKLEYKQSSINMRLQNAKKALNFF